MSNAIVPSKPSAKIIADSLSEWGIRLTTMEVTMHRFILAEFNTHRAFSRNSASSRAIPVWKIIERVETDPAYPVSWPAEQSGMSGGEELVDPDLAVAKAAWDSARKHALDTAKLLKDVRLHKSIINRLLEPFMWHTVIVTSTQWANFFAQRCNPAAQPEMQAVAYAMKEAYLASTPVRLLDYNDYHLPYIDQQTMDSIGRYIVDHPDNNAQELAARIAIARCARVSYLTHDGVRDIEKDLELFYKLETSGHWSPFEHVASSIYPYSGEPSGNFTGWKQFRQHYFNECVYDIPEDSE